jgi:hypothetical protein
MIEPSADIRMLATSFYQLYVAYQQAGFTEPQAMDLVKTQISSLAMRPPTEDSK